MPKFRITVTAIDPDGPSEWEDRNTPPNGIYEYYACCKEGALDVFHHSVPIACLEDFNIDVEMIVCDHCGFKLEE
jgi:hypothetical protein